MNHHDTSQQPTPTALCARIAPLLPALDEWGELSALTLADGAPSSDELALAQTHLATCVYCQAQRDVYARLDVALHNAVGLRAIAPLRTADIMAGLLRSQPNTLPMSAEMGAEMGAEIAPTLTIAAATMIAAPVTQADARTRAPSGASLPAAPPSARSGRALARRKRWAPVWLATVAAALVIALLAAGIVRSVGVRVGGSPSGTGKPITPAPYTGDLFLGERPALTNITMVSPTEGWAIGLAQSGKPSLIYHLLDNAWAPVTLSASARAVAMSTPTAIAFDSPMDGWAFFSTVVSSVTGERMNALHYDGHSWNPLASDMFAASASECVVGAAQMVSPTDGWGVCTELIPERHLFLHFDGHTWSTVATPTSLMTPPNGTGRPLQNAQAWLTDLSMVSATDGWAVGYITGPSDNPNQRIIGFVLRYVHGQWIPYVKRYDYEFRTVSALASGDVWVGGEQVKYQDGAGELKYAQASTTPILMRTKVGGASVSQPVVVNQPGYFTLEIWTTTPLPLPKLDPTFTNIGTLTQVLMHSPTDGWALGSEVSQSHNKNGPQLAAISYLLLHYDGVRWQPANPEEVEAQSHAVIFIEQLGVTSNGDCWAVGASEHDQHGKSVASPGIMRYHDGAWKVYLS